MKTRFFPIVIAGAGLLAGMLPGCSYSTQRPFPTDLQTVHVEMFHSREFRRELEFELTEALTKRVEQDTPYRIAPLKTADAVITGEILRVDNRSFGNEYETDLPREIGSTYVIRFRIKDMRTGKILVDRPRFVYQSNYIPSADEKFELGTVRAMDHLAELIVETMETAW